MRDARPSGENVSSLIMGQGQPALFSNMKLWLAAQERGK